ncbi:hypothetical protein EVAR_33177_1 [Eumeta japonica]|uniref:Uncharacterized protein n=1 Tax=Eumeta variegata TaxID=151549 RepID=A0A4C1W3E2_EUMVA|nr:hypothetical protein EVAR_33177_1 [Eumeta japonica]
MLFTEAISPRGNRTRKRLGCAWHGRRSDRAAPAPPRRPPAGSYRAFSPIDALYVSTCHKSIASGMMKCVTE